ncbi:MAG: TetR/AcrR family transcriptional regulator [Prevotellaceae bacterium]|jgi:AcrR family transcriptional regulator|nr:TetR/AcrR family transcriptional regulator [Prevotellaceae bacterium]
MTQKERIIQEASYLFFQKGVRNVTMNDIAEHIGMSKRTIYEQIKDKDELLTLCLERFGEKTHYELLKVAKESNADLIDILRYFVDFAMSAMSNNVGRFFNEVKKYHPKVFLGIVETLRKTRIEHLTSFLEEGIKEGLFLPMRNLEMLATIIQDLVTIVDKSEDLEKLITPDSLRKLVVTFFRGIATPKGIERIDGAFKIKHDQAND